jgi:oxaloacetate decarboxylase gamma subunit
MLFGMGTVFVFLTLLVAVTGAMSTTVSKFATPPVAEPAATAPSAANQAVDPKVIAVIQAAIDQHRGR